MKSKRSIKLEQVYRAFFRQSRMRKLAVTAIVGVVVGGLALLLVAHANVEHGTNGRPPMRLRPAVAPAAQAAAQQPLRLTARLALQPEADRMRLRLGQRFLLTGREVTQMSGALSMGQASQAPSQPVRVTRTQTDDGESVAISLGGHQSALAWDQNSGALSGSAAAVGADRSLVERIALDSVDQFILAQLRGASYYTVARNVRPAEAGGSGSYTGPVWDVVRVGEANEKAAVLAQSPWRLYWTNSSTGLLERVVSKEPAGEVTADMSNWSNRGGELMPGHIVWKQNGQVVMELALDAVTNGPR